MVENRERAGGTGKGPRRRLGLATRLLIGFGAISSIVVLLAVANLALLARVSDLSESVLEDDLPVIDAAERWTEEILEQEYYARRAAILGGGQLAAVAREEAADFVADLDALGSNPAAAWVPFERLRELHARYTRLLDSAAAGAAMPQAREKELQAAQSELIALVKDTGVQARRNQLRKAEENASLSQLALRLMAAFCIAAVAVSVIATVLLTRGIARPVRELRSAAGRIAAGRFDVEPDVAPGDELGDLAADFAEMARRLKRLEELSLDASPLTRLPGNIALENVLSRRIDRRAPFVFCLVDLDDFKAYNDRYGYARGSELIKATARLVERTVREHGGPEDFVAHIGGDDFAIVTTDARFRDVCGALISGFDAMVRDHYDPEDARRGFVTAKSRQGHPLQHRLTSVSIAVVTSADRDFESPIQVGEVAADLKEYAKSLEGSVYVVDRRRKEIVRAHAAVVPFPKSG